jgi:hypothetical protein
MKSFIIFAPTKYYWGYRIQEGNMVMACSTHDRREKCVPDLRDHLENVIFDVRIVLK